MKTSKTNSASNNEQLFSPVNYVLLTFSIIFIVIGLVLMTGPANTFVKFEPDIFSTRRIIVAPIICLAGYFLVFIAILWHKNDLANEQK